MDLYQLRYFLEVARELSFRRAAENAYVSPPAITKSVAQLERSLQRKLFTRTKRSVELTADGEFLKEHVERIYDHIEQARLGLSEKGPAEPAILRIGSRQMIANYLLGPAFLEFHRLHPGTRFDIRQLAPADMIAALRRDRIDFAFHNEDISDSAIETRLIGGLSSHIYAARPLLSRKRLSADFKQVLELPFIAPSGSHERPSGQSLDGFPDHRYRRRIQYESELFETRRRFALDGLAAAVLPDFAVRREWERGLIFRLPGPRLQRKIYFLKRKGRPLPRAVDELVAIVRRKIKGFQGC